MEPREDSRTLLRPPFPGRLAVPGRQPCKPSLSFSELAASGMSTACPGEPCTPLGLATELDSVRPPAGPSAAVGPTAAASGPAAMAALLAERPSVATAVDGATAICSKTTAGIGGGGSGDMAGGGGDGGGGDAVGGGGGGEATEGTSNTRVGPGAAAIAGPGAAAGAACRATGCGVRDQQSSAG